jgi:hypothetical protein
MKPEILPDIEIRYIGERGTDHLVSSVNKWQGEKERDG